MLSLCLASLLYMMLCQDRKRSKLRNVFYVGINAIEPQMRLGEKREAEIHILPRIMKLSFLQKENTQVLPRLQIAQKIFKD